MKIDPQTLSALRVLMLVFGTWLTNHGYGNAKDFATISDPAVLEALLGLGLTAWGGIWALLSRTHFAILRSASHVLDGRGAIIAPPELAKDLPANVVASAEKAKEVPGVSAG